jgi:hypothetical protein
VIDFAQVAQEIFTVMQQFNYDVSIYDGSGNDTLDVNDARRFYSKAEDMGVYIRELAENSSVSMEKSDSVVVTEILGFKTSLQNTASRYNLMFSMEETKGPIRPQDHASDVVSEDRKVDMDLNEAMYGTSRSSYLKMDGAKLIVKHSSKVDETVSGARSRRIDRMYVENSRGERHLLPTKQLLAGKAITRHVSQGGELSDEVGTKLCEMADDYANLGTVIRHVRKNHETLNEDAVALQECAAKGRVKMRSIFEKIYRNYDSGIDALTSEPLNEASEEQMDNARSHASKSLYCDDCQIDENVLESVARFSFDLTKDPVEEKVEAPVEKDELRNPVIREYIEWLESFTVENALMEKHDVEKSTDEECEEEDDELSREDVLMPKSKKADYKREIVKKSPEVKATGSLLLDDSK